MFLSTVRPGTCAAESESRRAPWVGTLVSNLESNRQRPPDWSWSVFAGATPSAALAVQSSHRSCGLRRMEQLALTGATGVSGEGGARGREEVGGVLAA